MRPKEAIGQAEERYLRAVYDLASGQAKSAVSFHEVQAYLSYSDEEADRCCDFWTRLGTVEWPALGHIALTHVGLAQAVRLGTEDDPRNPSAGSVSVVIPVLNEAKTIAHLVQIARRDPRVLEVLVVDDGSIDGTPEIASNAGASVMISSLLGKGASMQDG